MKRFSVLIINHPVEESALFEQMMKSADFKCNFVQDQKSTMKILASEEPDIIFIDPGMNLKSGIETCRHFKSNALYEKIPVIFILQTADRKIIDECFESGCSDYILKPLNSIELSKKAMFHIEVEFSRQVSRDVNQILEEKIVKRTLELEESMTKLNKANKELEMLDIAKTEFLDMISHEIRTPLNGIMGSLRLIGRYHFSDEVNSYFSLLNTSVKRLERFSNDIMEASNLRLRGEKILIFSDFNPVIIIEEIIDLCQVIYSDKVIQTSVKDKSNKSFIHADAKYVRKCFHAVVDNAFKFSPRGGTINVSVEKSRDGLLNIRVSDEGPGFPRDAEENIYEALNNSHSHYDGNTGMGLHLAKLIVEAHSGKITAGNIQPHGAEIKIDLPLTKKMPLHPKYH